MERPEAVTQPAAVRAEVACARCGCDERGERFHIHGWRLVDCVRCGLRYVSPRLPPDEYAAQYDQAYFCSPDSLRRGYEDYAGERASILATFRRRLARIQRHAPALPGGRYLDVGCALGYALEVAADAGMLAHGVDVSPFAVAQARARGLAVERGGVEAAERTFTAAGPLRLVTSWDVIEHLPDPRAHLAALARMMEPGGVLSIITPDRDSVTARLLGPRWVEYQKPEEHIYFFRRGDLEALLLESGFDVLDRTTAGKYVPIAFALSRLGAYVPLAPTLARALGRLGARTVYVDPLDKMHLIARRRAGTPPPAARP
jgi:SAM-dependent methyltransferase